MPHGPGWNRLNMLGQVVLAFAFALLGLRIAGWVMGPQSWPSLAFTRGFASIPYLNYQWSVDLFLSGVFGVGLYFWFSGRTWCRFACPLAALMHIYARFSRFRIFADKVEVHLVQRLHERLPPGYRRDELRQQGRADGRPAMRALLGVRAGMSDGVFSRSDATAATTASLSSSTVCRPRPVLMKEHAGAEMTNVWIDTDPSIGVPFHEADDGFALIQAFHSPELRIRGISTSYGNAGLATTTRIAREIAGRFGGPAGDQRAPTSTLAPPPRATWENRPPPPKPCAARSPNAH